MKSSTLLAGLLALLIACGVSFGAGYYLAKSQGTDSPTPKTLVSDTGETAPSLDTHPLDTPNNKPATTEEPATQPETPEVTTKPAGDIQPAVNANKTSGDKTGVTPPPVEGEPTPKDLRDQIKDLEAKLKDLPAVDPDEFETLFNGPQVDFTATISGQVVDQAGTPVAGASVNASYSENYTSGDTGARRVSFVMASGESKGTPIATTDSTGSFSATITRKISERANLQVSMTGTADGFAESEKTTFTLKNGDDKQGVKLALRGAGSVSGRVIDASGRGVSGVNVGLNTAGNGSFYGDTLELGFGSGSSKYSGTTDGAGEFIIEGVAEGRYKFRLTGAGYRQISGPTEIDIKAGEAQRAPADFQVAVTASVAVKFINAAGSGVAGWVTLSFKDDSGKVVKRIQGQIGSDGTFEKNDPPAGTFSVEITAWGFKPQTVAATIIEGQRYDFGTITLEPSEDEGGTSIILPGEDD
jgi:protocatechuate 3,4-dioxygenase beta subunit